MLGLIRVIRLLFISKVPKRLRCGKFSSLTISLSDKSTVSNWSCQNANKKSGRLQVQNFHQILNIKHNQQQDQDNKIINKFKLKKKKLKFREAKQLTSVAPKFSITAILLPDKAEGKQLDICLRTIHINFRARNE